MAIFKRRKNILEGTSRVIIDSIVEKQHENGKTYFIITVIRKSDRATRQFWIVEDSYLIEKIIDAIFKGDEREEFDTKDFIGKEIIIDVKKSEYDYFNITSVHPVEEDNDEDSDEEDNEYDEENLENELFKENSYYIEDNDDFDLDIDEDDFDLDDDDLPSQNLRNGRRR